MRALKKIKKIGIALAAVFSIAYMSGCASRPADESAAEETKVVQTDKGEVEIPAHPQRIVSDYYLGEFLAVDTKPVIASPYALDNPYWRIEVGRH